MIHSAVNRSRANSKLRVRRAIANQACYFHNQQQQQQQKQQHLTSKLEAMTRNNTSPIKWAFKEKHSAEQRFSESSAIRDKFPDCVPVVVQKSAKSHLKDLDKCKWVVPYDLTVAQFMYILRDRLKLTQKESIYVFIDRTLPQSSATIGELWTRHRDEDNFLYFMFSEENTFG
ncbi:gamma-aminobutyric acid receptor-associated protein-like 2 [Brevipalpus obovatus]|uniref:gamma-aminobutyric acid receptor-associated protein-like 2 n=1 Tax=Brevipalpus obovatus TaxID=246614 RepID=UPI003D9ED2C5